MNEREAVLTKIAGHRAELTRLGVRSLALFGSTARGEARVDSDVDLLVDFARPVGLFAFLEVKTYLEHLLGRPVDLVTASALRPESRDTVLREAVHAWAPTCTPTLQVHLGIAVAGRGLADGDVLGRRNGFRNRETVFAQAFQM